MASPVASEQEMSNMAPASKKRRLNGPEAGEENVTAIQHGESLSNVKTSTIDSDPVSDSAADSSSDAEPDQSVQTELRNISFGALSEAQSSLRKTEADGPIAEVSSTAEEKVQLLRERLAELKRLKSKSNRPEEGQRSILRGNFVSRSSKHAPTEQSSQRAVTRKRPAVEVSQNPHHSRDPRFFSVSGQLDTDRVRQNYAFLSEYRASEITDLKDKLKKVKDENEKDRLRREINAMENKAKAEREKERQREVAAEHKRKEREAIKQGKRPYFLKRSEQKKQAEAQKLEGMKAKEKDKALQKKNKRESQKERRNMPVDSRWIRC